MEDGTRGRNLRNKSAVIAWLLESFTLWCHFFSPDRKSSKTMNWELETDELGTDELGSHSTGELGFIPSDKPGSSIKAIHLPHLFSISITISLHIHFPILFSLYLTRLE